MAVIGGSQRLGALEQHMFEQMGHAPGFAGFVHRSDADGDIGGEGRRIVTFHQQQFQPIGEGVFADLLGQGRGSDRRRQPQDENQRQTANRESFRHRATP